MNPPAINSPVRFSLISRHQSLIPGLASLRMFWRKEAMNQSTTTNQSELSGNENGMVALLAAQFEFSCCCSLLSRANPESKPTNHSAFPPLRHGFNLILLLFILPFLDWLLLVD